MRSSSHRSKQEVVTAVCRIAGIPEWRVSSGSTEPRGFLLDVARRFDVPIEGKESKPELARIIVETSGQVWLPRDESQGSTVTLDGLLKIEKAVVRFSST